MLFVVCVVILVEGGNPADMAALDGPDISSLSDNIDSTDDLVPSLQVSCVLYYFACMFIMPNIIFGERQVSETYVL